MTTYSRYKHIQSLKSLLYTYNSARRLTGKNYIHGGVTTLIAS